MDTNEDDIDGHSSPSSTGPEAEQAWATSTLNEASHGNASPSEVGESSHSIRPSSGFADEADPGSYSDDALPQPSDTYGSSCKASCAANDDVGDDAIVGISAYDTNEDGTSAELPSTTTADHGELAVELGMSTSSEGPPVSDEEIYAQEEPATSSTSLQSVQYVVRSYSAQQPASSTADYDVSLEDYDRTSPDVQQPSNECYEQRDYSDVAFPVSSSHVTSPTPLAEPGPSRSRDDAESDLYNSALVAVHSLHPCISEEQENAENGINNGNNHCLPSPSGQDDCPSGSGISENPDIEPLAASYVRIVGQRFATIELPPDVSVPPPPLTPQKENLVDSVMRTVIGCSSSSSSLPPDALLADYHHHHHHHQHHHHHHLANDIKDEVSSVADDDDGHGHYMVADPMLTVNNNASTSSVETTVTDSMSTTGLVTVSDSLMVAHGQMVARVDAHHMASSSAAACHANSNHHRLMSDAISNDHSGLQVQVSHVGNASNLHGYVSSSTGSGVDGLVSLSGRTIILDATVDSTVGTDCQVVGSSDGHYTLDVEHRMISVSELDDDYSNEVEGSAALVVDNGCNPETSAMETDADVAQTSNQRHLIQDDDLRDVNSTSIMIGGSAEEEDNVMRIMSSGPSEPMLDANSAILDASSVTASTSGRPRRRAQRKNTQNECLDGLWCEECHHSYEDGCSKHQVQTIYDKPVLTRAWASLPASYLLIAKTEQEGSEDLTFGVFAKKLIPKRTQFGPVEGVVLYVQPKSADMEQQQLQEAVQGDVPSSQSSNNGAPLLQIETNDGTMMLVDTTDESVSNWMRFVRLARTQAEQNLVIVQHNEALYFTTTCDILPRSELRVYYSEHYARRRGIPFLESSAYPQSKSFPHSWPCFECNQQFETSEDLQLHLNDHDTADAGASGTSQELRPVCRPIAKAIKRKITARSKFKIKKDEGGTSDVEALRTASFGEGDCSVQLDVQGRKLKSKKRKLSDWVCTQCNLAFDNNNTRNLHILTHAAMDVAAAGIVEADEEKITGDQVEVDCTNVVNGSASLDENQQQQPPQQAVVSNNLVLAELHPCPECNLQFASKRELSEHAGFHGRIFFRSYMTKEEASTAGEAAGRTVRNRANRAPIDKNGEKSGNLAKLRRSFRGLVNPAKPHKCEMCYKSFATEDRLQRHMLVHGNEDAKPLQCSVCGKRFLNNSALACHVKVHSEERKLYECPICKEDFDQIVTLKNHVQVHCINRLFTCPSCQKMFEEYNQIRKHIRAFHSEKKFPCEHCEKIFPRPDKLKLHMLRHSNHREFLCANCGKQFKRKDKLKEHMKRMHSAEREHRIALRHKRPPSSKKFIPKVLPTDYHRFIYKCHACLLGFKRRGMLVNHLAKRHPDIRPHTVPELNLPILKTTRDYYCQYCEKVYKSSSKRKAHILRQHPGAELPMSNRRKGGIPEIPGVPNPTFSQTVGSVTTHPHNCEWCHKQYASKAKLLQHQRKKHYDLLPAAQQTPRHQNRESSTLTAQPDKQKTYRQHLGNAQYFAVQDTIARLLQQEAPSEEMVDEENLTVEEQDIQQHHLLNTQTQTSNLEYSDVHVVGADIKPKLESSSVYGEPAIIIASMNVTDAQMDNLPHADLLTQAMSELTQPLADYGHVIVSDNGTVVHQVYEHPRIACSSSGVSTSGVSPSSSPGPSANSPSTSNVVDNAAVAAAEEIEAEKEERRSELGHLLGHYDVTVDANGQHSVIIVAEAEAIDVREDGTMALNVVESTVSEDAAAGAVTTTRTWATSQTYAEYSPR